jgi:hypothetical protein
MWVYAVDMARDDEAGHAATTLYRGADGQLTTDPARAVTGEIVHELHGSTRRTRFFLTREELPWLPVSEPAFLLWVLLALIVVWTGIALLLLVA